MKLNSIIKLIFSLSAVSIVAILISIFTYKNIDGKVESKMKIKKNILTERYFGETYFKFNENLNSIINSIKVGDEHIDINQCNINKVDNIMPITMEHRRDIGVYIVTIFNNKTKINQQCFEYILKILSKNYHDAIRLTIKVLGAEQNIVKNRNQKIYETKMQLKKEEKLKESEKYKSTLEKKMNVKFIKENEISFSNFLDILATKQIVEAFIGGGYVSGELINGTKFFSIFYNLVNSEILIKDLYKSGAVINIVNTNLLDSITLTPPTQDSLEYGRVVNTEILKKQLVFDPYILLKIKHNFYKITYYKYLTLFLVVFNLSFIAIFLIINKKFLKKLKELLNKF